MRAVFITGIGVIAPTGVGREAFWDGIIEDRGGIGLITRFDASSLPCRVAGQVNDRLLAEVFEDSGPRNSTHVVRLGIAAAKLALRDSRLRTGDYDPTRMGVSIGTALGGWREAEQQHSLLLERGAHRVNPFVSNLTPAHTIAIAVAQYLGAEGEQATFASGCSASLQAISHGALLVARGEVDLCIAGGAESPLIPTVVAGMSRSQELATSNNPSGASRPFDLAHCGMVLSEGGCVLMLEGLDSILARGAIPYAAILSGASSCDANGPYGLDVHGKIGARALVSALTKGNLAPSSVDYVCAHANSSPSFDRKETAVLKVALGKHARHTAVSSIKGVLGHPFGASGAFQTAAAALSIHNQLIPPTHHLENPDPLCDLDYVPMQARPARVDTAIVTSYGYGGFNSYLVLVPPS
jgi:3-oxoacyl-[acyl-carrier-protein] synthase II